MKRYAWFLLIFFIYSGTVFAQNNEEVDSVSLRFLEQLSLFPQEKIYVHTDKPNYMVGDTIWLRAHLVDAATHIPSPVSRYVYVELANSSDSVFSRIKIRVNDSIYRGYIPLDYLIPQGYYTLRAYTGFMKNLPEDYLFKSTLSIINPVSGSRESEEPEKGKKKGKEKEKEEKLPQEAEPFDVKFFPEGGYLPAGIPWRVAFKAIGKDGWHEEIHGAIKDKDNGEVVATLPATYLGMGFVTFVPEAGRQYVAECTNSQNRFLEFELPQVTPQAQVITTTWRKNMLMIALSQPVTTPLRLVAQSRGIVFYSELWQPKQKILTFNARELPAGVIQILLLDEKGHPLSERLVFNKYFEEISMNFTTDKPSYGIREAVKAEVTLTDSEGKPLEGDFSVSVTDDTSVNTHNCSSILSYLLLASELKGTIEFPEAYFDVSRKEADRELDVLMMTQGWRRYNIPNLLKGQYERPSIFLERCQEISGKVLNEFNSKPRANAPISILALEHLFSDETISDSTGVFRFTHFEFPDSTNFIVKGVNKRGGAYNVMLELDQEKFYPFGKQLSIEDLYNKRSVIEEYDIDTLDNSGIQTIRLDEVVIKAKPKEKQGKSMYHSINGSVYDTEKLMYPRPNTMADMLSRLPGILARGNSITLRGNTPLILVDDVEMEYELVMDMQPDDIAEIELMKDASAAIFGSRGAGGAILITTKTGDGNFKIPRKLNVTSIRPLGYQIPVEFYSPKYSPTQGSLPTNQDNRNTLYWSPCIKLSDTGKGQFEFCTADKRTSYTVIMQGVTHDGKIIFKKEQINKN